MARTSPSCSKKPSPRSRFVRAARTSTQRSAAAGTRAGSSIALGPAGRLVALDRDPAAEGAARAIADTRFTFRRAWFSELPRGARGARTSMRVDGVLLDLGVSSPQIDDPARGFSLRADGPLDMRMDPSRGESAAEFIARADVRELTEVIRDHGEERFAQSIARAIVAARAVAPVVRTRQLAALVAQAVRTRPRGDRSQDPATRTFQALRIHVNRELAELALTLPQAVRLLAPGGRLAVISFHSLEDRIVKRFFAAASQPYGGDRAPRAARRSPRPRCRARRSRASDARSARPRARSKPIRAHAARPCASPNGRAHPIPAGFDAAVG